MHRIFFSAILFCTINAKAQTVAPLSIMDCMQPARIGHTIPVADSASEKKWLVTSYTGISGSVSFLKGGYATAVAVPLQMQLTRKLNNNFYAFAAVSGAPVYFTMYGTGNTNIKPVNNAGFMQPGKLGIYSRAELGLMYVNDAKTFSISGSIGIEKNNYPAFSVYPPTTVRPNPTQSFKR